jgi:hypothetical protein
LAATRHILPRNHALVHLLESESDEKWDEK